MFFIIRPMGRRSRVLTLLLPLATVLCGAAPGLSHADQFLSANSLQALFDPDRSSAVLTDEGIVLGRASSGSAATEFNASAGEIVSLGSSSTKNIRAIGMRDFTSNGRLDVATAGVDGIHIYYTNLVSGTLSFTSTKVTDTPFQKMIFGNFSGTGHEDIIAGSNTAGSSVTLYKNAGDGSFPTSMVIAGNTQIADLAAADLDNDSDADLVLAIWQSSEVRLYESTGVGVFTQAPRSYFPYASGQNRAIAVGDVNGDGLSDIILRRKYLFGPFGTSDVYYNEGNSEFSDPAYLGFEISGLFNSISLGDMNNDSRLDIVVNISENPNSVYLQPAGSRGHFPQKTIGGLHATAYVFLSDMDGSGTLDVIEGNMSGYGTYIYLNPGDGNFSGVGSQILTSDTNAVAVGDLTGDSSPDVVTGDQGVRLRAWINPSSSTAVAEGTLYNTNRGWAVSTRVHAGSLSVLVQLTATEVKPVNTEITYYLSEDGGRHWRQVYPGESVRFDEAGDDLDLHWGARLTSLSPTTSPRIVRIGIEEVLDVSINGFSYKRGWSTATAAGTSASATLRLWNRGQRELEIGWSWPGGSSSEGFRLPSASVAPTIGAGEQYETPLMFEPTTVQEAYATTLTIYAKETGDSTSDPWSYALPLSGRGLAGSTARPMISVKVSPSDLSVRVGESTTVKASIVYKGDPQLFVENVTLSGPFRLVKPWQATTLSVSSGESSDFSFDFSFSPRQRGAVSGALRVYGRDSMFLYEETLTGTGTVPEMVVSNNPEAGVGNEYPSGSILQFVPEGETLEYVGNAMNQVSKWKVINIHNLGNEALTINKRPRPGNPVFSLLDLGDLIFPRDIGAEDHFAVGLVFKPTASGVATGTMTILSDDPGYTEEDPYTLILEGEAVAPKMEVEVVSGCTYRTMSTTPTRVCDFGEVRAKRNTTKATLIIYNTGHKRALKVSSVTPDGNGFDIGDGLADSVIPYGGSRELELLFSPSSTTAYSGSLTIVGNDPDPAGTTWSMTLRGTGVAPRLKVNIGGREVLPPTATLDFGDVEVGTTRGRTITLTNVGSAPLKIYPLHLGSSTYSAPAAAGNALSDLLPPLTERHVSGYHVAGSAGGLLPVGSATSITLHFAPRVPSEYEKVLLQIESDDLDYEKRTLHLTGRGIGPLLHTVVEVEGRRNVVTGSTVYPMASRAIDEVASGVAVVHLHNLGNASLDVQTVFAQGSTAFRFASSASQKYSLTTQNRTASHRMYFDPQTPGPATATLAIRSSDTVYSALSIGLAGTGTAPAMDVLIDGVSMNGAGFRHSFGRRAVGVATMPARIEIANSGTSALRVDGVRLAGAPSFGYDGVVTASVIAGTATQMGAVSFAPPLRGAYGTTLTIMSNNYPDRVYRVYLSGTGTAPAMEVSFGSSVQPSGNVHSFGTVSQGTGLGSLLTVRNVGEGVLSVEEPLVDGAFSVRKYNHNATYPLTIGAMQNAGFFVSFDASMLGTAMTTMTIASNDPRYEHSTYTLGLRVEITGPRMVVECVGPTTQTTSSDTCDFGDVPVGEKSSATLTVGNTGYKSSLRVLSIQTAGTGFRFDEEIDTHIAAGGSQSWQLYFSPDDATVYQGTATVATNAGDVELSLTGKGVEPKIFVVDELETLDFGGVTVGETNTKTATIINTGTAPLRIESIIVAATTFTPAVSIPDNNEDVKQWLNERHRMAYTVTGGTGEELAPGASTTLTVAFSPRVPSKDDDAVLTIHSNAPEHTVRLRGKGLGPLLLASIGADDNRRYVLSEATTHNVGTLVASDGVAVSTNVKVRLQNIGNSDLQVVADLTTGSKAFRSNFQKLQEPISVNNSEDIAVEFHPTKSGTHTRTLTLTTSGSTVATHKIHFHGSRRLPLMEVGFGDGCHPTSAVQTCNFGDTRAGSSKATTLIVTNNGTVPLYVTPDLADVSGVYSLAPPTAQSVAAGLTAEWVVRFAPRTVGNTYATTLTVTGDHPDAGERSMPLTGFGTGPIPDVTYAGCAIEQPSYCDLSDVPLGTTATVRVMVENKGNADLVVSALDVPSPYTVEGSRPATISSGSSRTWSVQLRAVPSRQWLRSPYGAKLRIISDYHGVAPEKNLTASVIWPAIEVAIDSQVPAPGGAYDFGEVRVGTTNAVVLTIKNTGHKQALALRSVRVSGDSFSIDSGSTATIAVGGSVTRELRFSPRVATTGEGQLTIVSNDADDGVWERDLAGEGTAPRIRVFIGGALRRSGGTYDFGSVRVGSTTSKVLAIANDGKAALTVSSIVASGTTYHLSAPREALSQLRPSLSERHSPAYMVADAVNEVPAGSSASVTLRFVPSIPSDYDRASLLIVSDDLDHPDWELELTGRGVGPLLHYTVTGSEIRGRTWADAGALGETTVGEEIELRATDAGVEWRRPGKDGALYAVRSRPARLYRVDAETGISTLIGDVVGQHWHGLASVRGELYGVRSDNNLYRADVETGASVLIGGVAGIQNGLWYGITFMNGVLYAINDANDSLYRINEETRVAMPVGAIGGLGSGRWTGLGSLHGVLYALDQTGNSLYSVSAENGVSTLVGSAGSLGNKGWDGLASLNGILYAVDSWGNSLYRLDVQTGAATLVGRTGSLGDGNWWGLSSLQGWRYHTGPIVRVGDRVVGETRADPGARIRLQNLGNATAAVDADWTTNSTALRSSFGKRTSYSLPPDADIDFYFEPEEPGTHTAALRIASSDGAVTLPMIVLQGRGLTPAMDVLANGVSMNAHRFVYSFGERPVGASTSVQVSISNVGGTAPLRVAGVSADGDPSFSWEGTAAVTVDAGSSASSVFSVSFAPARLGPHTATLTLVSNDYERPSYEVTLTGNGVPPPIHVGVVGGCEYTPRTGICDFGEVWAGSSRSATVVVTNNGDETVEVVPVNITGTYSLDAFVARSVGAGASASWVMRFAPPDIDTTYTGALTFAGIPAVKLTGFSIGPGMTITYGGCKVGFNPRTPEKRSAQYCFFGDVPFRGTASATMTISNDGNRPLAIRSLRIRPPFEFRFARTAVYSLVGPSSLTLAAGSSRTWTLNMNMADGSLHSWGERRIWSWLSIESDYHKAVSRQYLAANVTEALIQTWVEGRRLEANGAVYSFGEVGVGTTKTVTLTIGSLHGGNEIQREPLSVRSMEVTGDAFSVDGAATQIIPVGGLHTWRVSFSPNGATTSKETLTIFSNATIPEWRVRLEGVGVVPRSRPTSGVLAEIAGVAYGSGDTFDFGQVAVATTEWRTVRIVNSGTAEIGIESIQTTAADFHLTAPSEALARLHPPLSERRRMGYAVIGDVRTIPAGGSRDVALRFAPSIPSDYDRAALIIKSGDPGRPDWTLNLTGRGVGPLLHTYVSVGDVRHYNISESAVFDIEHPVQARKVGDNGVPVVARVHFWNIGNDSLNTALQFEPGGTRLRSGFGSTYERRLQPFWRSSYDVALHLEPYEPGISTGTLTVTSSDGTFPRRVLRWRAESTGPEIDVAVGEHRFAAGSGIYDFGQAPVREAVTASVVIRNTGNAALEIRSVAVAGAGYSSAGAVVQSIPGGSSDSLVLRFSPSSTTRHRGELIIHSNDPDEGNLRLGLRGRGVTAPKVVALRMSDGSYGFGKVRTGTAKIVPVRITNTSDDPITAYGPTVTGAGFSLVNGGRRTIAAGSSGTWMLRFVPSTAGTHTGKLTVIGFSGAWHAWGLRLEGVGAEPRMVVEVDGRSVRSGSEYDSGRVALGTTKSVVVAVHNRGNADLVVASVSVTGSVATTGASYDLGGDDAVVTRLAVNSSVSFVLHYRPQFSDNAGLLTIASDDPKYPGWSLDLRGRGTGPVLWAFYHHPYHIRSQRDLQLHHGKLFDISEWGRSQYAHVYLCNGGDEPLRIIGMSVEGDFRLWYEQFWSSPTGFRHMSSTRGGNTGFVHYNWAPNLEGIPVEAGCVITYISFPTFSRSYTGALVFHTNYGLAPTFRVPLRYTARSAYVAGVRRPVQPTLIRLGSASAAAPEAGISGMAHGFGGFSFSGGMPSTATGTARGQ